MNLLIQKNGNTPIYLQIKEQLKDYIANHKLQEGDRLPNIQNIAEAAGVSLRTAYLGVEALRKEGICYKRPKNGIFVSCRQNNYGLQNLCGIYDRRHFDSYDCASDLVQQAIFRGLSGNAERYQIETFFITNKPDQTLDFYGRIKEVNLTGVFMLYWDTLEEGIFLAKRFPHLKFIYLNYFLKDFEQTPENIHGVFNDDYAGAYQMVSNVLSKGYERLKIFTLDLPDENYKRRVDGFLAGMNDCGYRATAETVASGGIRGKKSIQELGSGLAANAFAGREKPDVILCVNDLLAEGVFDFLKENNITGVRVTGYDNILKHISLNKGFSTVAIDFSKMAAKALDIISGKAKSCPKIINIPPQVIERNLSK